MTLESKKIKNQACDNGEIEITHCEYHGWTDFIITCEDQEIPMTKQCLEGIIDFYNSIVNKG